MIQNKKFDLAILLFVSLLLGTYLFFRTYVIALDGAFQYIPMAKVFAAGSFKEALGFGGQQPLYSFFIALVSPWVSDFELAGRLISSFFGVMLIFPVYFLGKRIFDQKIAFFSALFVAIHPYIRRFSADVLKESTYLFFLAVAIWFAMRTTQGKKKIPYLFIPLFSAIAYLVRPDGFEVLVVVFLYILFIKKFDAAGERWKVILLLLLSSAILFLPYLIHLKGSMGSWTLSKAKSISGLLGLGAASDGVPFLLKILISLKKLNLEFFSLCHPLYVFFLAIGLFKRASSHFKDEEKFLISFFILHYVVLFLLILNFTDWREGASTQSFVFSGRHILPLFLISIYWAGEGFLTIYQWVSKKVESHRLFLRLNSKRKSMLILVTLLVLVLTIVLPKTLQPQRLDKIGRKEVGLWLRKQVLSPPLIMTDDPRVAYYAGGTYVFIPPETRPETRPEKIVEEGKKERADYLAFEGKGTVISDAFAPFEKKGALELVLRHPYGSKGRIMYVYKMKK
ncbi:MAG: glycosyltransferase family 39 protein [Desulfobacterales bacterium]|nr:glycosyltransferase family 39 protein [Desulfobacterales bacterium]